ncbi:DUF115 domain-containing protein [bacterium]|nr:DUF115 domain-containing protein [bacterium]
MSYLESNLLLLEKKDAQLAQKLRNSVYDDSLVTKLDSGLFDIVYPSKNLKYKGNPHAEVEKSLQALRNASYPKFIIFYGLGLGYGVLDYFKNPSLLTSHILLIEKSLSYLRISFELFDWAPVLSDERVHLVAGIEDERDLELAFMEYMSKDLTRIQLFRANSLYIEPSFSKEEGEYYKECAESLRLAINVRSTKVIGNEEDGYFGFMQLFKNLPNAAKSNFMDELTGKFEGVPAVLVGAGPSLKHSYEWLRQIQDKAIIATCDAALRGLVNNGITPHFVSTLERTYNTRYFYEDLPPLPHTWLVVDPIVSSELYDIYPGPILNMVRGICQNPWYFAKGYSLHSTGHSVTNQLYVFLANLGVSKIYLAGQDFAYDRYSDSTHGVNMPEKINSYCVEQRENSLQDNSANSIVEGNDGKDIRTEKHYTLFRKELEYEIVKHGKETYNVISEDFGSKISNTKRINPNDAAIYFGDDQGIANSIHSKLRVKTPVEIAKHIKLFYDRAEQAIQHLKVYNNVSLDILDTLSYANMVYISRTFDDLKWFNDLFKKIEKVSNDLFSDKDSFYTLFFDGVFTTKRNLLSSYSQEITASQKLSPDALINARITMAQDWFYNIHKWSGRMLHFMERNLQQLEKARKKVLQDARANV